LRSNYYSRCLLLTTTHHLPFTTHHAHHSPLTAHRSPLTTRRRRIFEHKRLMTVLPPPINLPYVLLFVLHHYAAALWRGFVAAFAALRCCRAGKRVSPLTDLPGSTATVLKAFADGLGDTEQRLLGERRLSDKARRKELLVERSVKQYVEKFLDDEAEARANTVLSLTQSTGAKVGALEESLTGKLAKLSEKLEELEGYVRLPQ
jgi:hypothetical protein